MFNINVHDHKIRQAELIQEAEKYRLIRSLREKKSSPKGIASKVQGLINTLILP